MREGKENRNPFSGLTGCQGGKLRNKEKNKHNLEIADESLFPGKAPSGSIISNFDSQSLGLNFLLQRLAWKPLDTDLENP